MEPEEEPRNARETPRRMAGHGSAGASPYRQGGGHGLAWIMGLFRGKTDIFGCGRDSDGTRPDEEAERSAGRRPVRARRPRSPFSSGRGVLRTVTKGHKEGGEGGRTGRGRKNGIRLGRRGTPVLRTVTPTDGRAPINSLIATGYEMS
jgi:hypothetical protein